MERQFRQKRISNKVGIEGILEENNVKCYSRKRADGKYVVCLDSVNRDKLTSIVNRLVENGYHVQPINEHYRQGRRSRAYARVRGLKLPDRVSYKLMIVVAPPKPKGPVKPMPNPDGE